MLTNLKKTLTLKAKMPVGFMLLGIFVVLYSSFAFAASSIPVDVTNNTDKVLMFRGDNNSSGPLAISPGSKATYNMAIGVYTYGDDKKHMDRVLVSDNLGLAQLLNGGGCTMDSYNQWGVASESASGQQLKTITATAIGTIPNMSPKRDNVTVSCTYGQ